MKKEYLTSMTAFVLAQKRKRFIPTECNTAKDFEDFKQNIIDLILSYAEFLSQKNELGFFVPCDEKGNVLTEPKEFKDWMKSDHYFNASESVCHDCRMFKKAKERVLFKDAKFDTYGKLYCGGLLIGYSLSNDRFHFQTELKTIENVANEFQKIEYTESAIKKIGLENG